MKIKKEIVFKRLERAKKCLSMPIIYGWGRGGLDPKAPYPDDLGNGTGRCDCTGFLAWVAETSRKPVRWRFGAWFHSTTIYNQAKRGEVYIVLPEPQIGCFIVYPQKGLSPGHVGLVVNTNPLTVIDCSSGGYKLYKKAVNVRRGDFFLKRGAIFVTFKSDV